MKNLVINDIKGQSFVEYAVALAVILAFVAGFQLYSQRSLQSRYKSGVDYWFSQAGLGRKQYDPYYYLNERGERVTSVEQDKHHLLTEKRLFTHYLNDEVTVSGHDYKDFVEDE